MPTDQPRLIVRDASGSERDVEINHTPFTPGSFRKRRVTAWKIREAVTELL